MKYILTAIVFGALFGMVNVALSQEATIDLNPPEYVEEMPGVEFMPEFKRAGSLFGSGERPLFADRRAMKPNDIITVIISDNATASFSANKNYTGNSGNGSITPPRITYNGNDAEQRAVADALNNQAGFSYNKGVRNRNFQNSGNLNRNENMSATLSARVIKVLENGNYFIYGHREILVDGEKQTLSLSGVIRPYDVERDNSIQSKYIADAKISYNSAGNMSLPAPTPSSEVIEGSWPF